MQFNLENLYTKLSVVEREKPRWIKKEQNVELSDIFDKDEDKESGSSARIILIEGSPGTGKTTLSLKLAYDWATGKMPNKFPEVELVLLIKCRDMEASIQESAKTQLLPCDNDQLRNALDSFIHSGKIMLIIDGFDEIPKSAESHVVDLLNGKVLQNCYVVVTSRQEKGMEVRKCCDKLLEIDGFSDESRNSFIDKYFTSNNYLAKKLKEKIQTRTENNLQSLATNPLNALLLCVVFEDNDGDLPTTVTELYENIVECIWKRYCNRNRPEEKGILFENAMQTLGKLAYECLIERDTLYFSESMLKDEDEKLCTNIGFLYKDTSTKILKPDNTYWFLHKRFQEYFAAYHCVYIEKEIDMSKLSYCTSQDGAKFIQVLKFLSSMLQKKNTEDHKKIIAQLASRISQNVECESDEGLDIMCQVLSENELDKDLAGAVKTFIQEDLKVPREKNKRYYSIMPRILNLLVTGGEDKETLKLRTLEFEGFDDDTEWLRLICEALLKNLVVDRMELFYCKLEGTFLQQMLSENSTLQSLSIGACFNCMTFGAVNTLAKGLCKNSTLNELSLKNIGLGLHEEPSSEFTGMVEMFQTNVTLKSLHLELNPLSSDGVTWIAEALGSNQGLKELSLVNTECDDDGAAALAKMLRINKTLERLALCNYEDDEYYQHDYPNSIGDEGATALADVLKEYNSSLRELHLCRNTDIITNTGLRKLIEAVQKNKRLTLYIDLPEQISITLDEETMKRIKPLDCNFTQGKITTTSYTSALLAEF